VGDESDNTGNNPFDERIAASEFDHWIRPAKAVEHLGYYYLTARAQMIRELENGLLRASAAKAIWRYNSNERDDDYVLMPKWAWKLGKSDLDSDFWSTGFFEMNIPLSSGGYEIRSNDWVRFFDVRFDPARFPQGPASGDPEAVTDNAELAPKRRRTRHGLPELKEPMMLEWLALFRKAYPSGSKQLAESSAQGMFPDHSVDRQKVRDLMGDTGIGRPPKSKDKQ